jgi:hypothetical protein
MSGGLDPALADQSKPALDGAAIEEKTTSEWMAILVPAEIPVAPINTMDRALADPSLIACNMIVELEHTLGGKVKSLGNPVHMSEHTEQPYASPPCSASIRRRCCGTRSLVDWQGAAKAHIEADVGGAAAPGRAAS